MSKVSVIMPSYNNASLISEAIESVFNQSFKDYEIIVIDSSTDNTKEVLLKYNEKIRYFYQEPRGVSAARNLGIQKATSEYISFLDPDDLWFPDYLQVVMRILECDTGVYLIYSNLQVRNGKEVLGIKPGKPALKVIDFWYGARIVTSAVTVRRKCFEIVGLFDEELKIAEDTDLWIRIMNSGLKIHYEPRVLAVFRLDNPYSLTKNSIRLFENHVRFHLKHLHNKDTAVPKKLIKQNLAWQYYLLGKEYFNQHDYSRAVDNIIKALSIDPLLKMILIKRKGEIFFKKYLLIMKPYLGLGYCIYKLATQKKIRHRKNSVINVLYYEPSTGFGGSSRSLSMLLNHIDRSKYYPIVATKNYGFHIENVKDIEIVKLRDYNPNDNLLKLNHLFGYMRDIIFDTYKIFKVIKQRRVSLVHINVNIMTGIPAILAAKLSRIQCICHIRGNRKLIKRERSFASCVDKFIVLSKKGYDSYTQYIPKEKLTVVFNGIEIDKFQRVDKGDFRDENHFENSFIFGIVGRIVKGKGQKEFILAAKEVLKVNPIAKFLIIGDAFGDNDQYYKETKELVKSKGLSSSIIFTGWRKDINRVIVDLDIIVQATTTFPEGFGLTIIEAMVLEKPVIATDIPGPSEIVVNGETGYLVPPGDVNALAEKMIYLMKNQNIAREMGVKGLERVKKCFDIKDTAKNVEKVYEEILSRSERNS